MLEFLTAILVGITGFYAWSTFRILKANEQAVTAMQGQNEAVTRPYITISVFVLPDNPILYLRVTNTGKTSANRLRLQMDKDFYKFAEKKEESNLAKLSVFSEEIACFPPGAELIFPLAQGFKVFGNNSDQALTPPRFEIGARYEYSGKWVDEKTTVDLTPWKSANIPLDPIVTKLKDIKDAIEGKPG